MHIKSIVSDEDREELERMLSLGFIIPNQLFKTRQKSRMIIYIFTPVEFLLSINCYLSESYLMFGIGIGTCVACVAWIIWYQMIGKNFEKNVHEFVWGRSGYETVDIDENAIKIDEDMESDELIKIIKTTGILFEKKEKPFNIYKYCKKGKSF